MNFRFNVGYATPVGIFPQGNTPEGIEGLAGNVWEWCVDWFAADYYAKSPDKNPRGPESGEPRVLRGGGWAVNAQDCRAATRIYYPPDDRIGSIGFRLVVLPPELS